MVNKLLRDPRMLLFTCPFLLMAPVWLTGQAMYWGTPSTQFVPWWWQAWQTLLGGELPLWNPLVGMGAPLLANYQSALVYPPNWIYFGLAALGGVPLMAWGQAPLVATHLAIAGWGMAQLIRDLGKGELAQTVGGLAFALSGYLVARAHFLSINSAVAWLPWILWAVYRLAREPRIDRHTLLLAFGLALQWLAGHAQTAWYTLLLATAWAIFWSWQFGKSQRVLQVAIRFVSAGLLAFAVSAVQLIPTAEYLLNSQRSAQVDFAQAATYSFWPWRSLSMLSSNFFGNPVQGTYWGYGNFWEDATYIGLLPLLLALSAIVTLGRDRKNRPLFIFLTTVSIVSILLALGNNTPLFRWLYDHVPSFSLFQSPTRFSIWLVFAFALLAAYQVENWGAPRGKALYWSRLAVASSVGVLVTATIAVLVYPIGKVAGAIAWALVATGLIALAVAIMNVQQSRLKSKWVWFVSALIAFDLVIAGVGLNPGTTLDLYQAQNSPSPDVTDQIGDGRLYLPAEDERALKFEHLFRFDDFFSAAPIEIRQAALPNIFLLDRVRSSNNFDPFVPAAYKSWADAVAAADAAEWDRLLAEAGITVIERADSNGAVDFAAMDALPRVRWLSCEEASGRIVGQSVECDQATGGSARILNEGANFITVRLDADGGWLVLADIWYPGWKALVDSSERTIYMVDGFYRAINLREGDQQVTFVYEPASFTTGLALSAVGLIVSIFLWRRASLRS